MFAHDRPSLSRTFIESKTYVSRKYRVNYEVKKVLRKCGDHVPDDSDAFTNKRSAKTCCYFIISCTNKPWCLMVFSKIISVLQYLYAFGSITSRPRCGINRTFTTTSMSQTTVSLFVVGDVMLGRGIDMILSHHNDPILYESNGLDAFDYVTLAERQNGPIPPPSERDVTYIWGDAIQILDEKKPDVRIINLETSVTTSSTPWPMKGINYRMHPGNIDVIKAAKIDCCVLANNHVADWGFEGLNSTLTTLKNAGIKYAGAGQDQEEVEIPAIFDVHDKGRVIVFAAGHHSSGVPDSWKASSSHGGVNIIEIFKPKKAVSELQEVVRKYKQENDIAVLSLHWGGNWGFDIDSSFKKFAYAAIDNADIDLIYGHSSHHVKGVEVYHNKLIIYGCGDFLNDYEGITGYEHFRDDLALMYFVEINPVNGQLVGLKMVPTQTKYLRVNNAPEEGIQWLFDTMRRECKKMGALVERKGNELHLVL